MAEQIQQATDEEIVDTLMHIYDEVAEVVQDVPDVRRMTMGAISRNLWSMDVTEQCRLTVEERHNNRSLPIDGPMQDPYGMKVSIHLDLPEDRQANFVIGLPRGDAGDPYFIDEVFSEGLSRDIFLRLLGVEDVKHLWTNLKHRSAEPGVRKDATREIIFWPFDRSGAKLYTHSTATNGVPTSASVRLDSEVADFGGTVDLAWSNGVRTLKDCEYRDKRLQADSESGITQASLSKIGDIALSIIIDHITCADRSKRRQH